VGQFVSKAVSKVTAGREEEEEALMKVRGRTVRYGTPVSEGRKMWAVGEAVEAGLEVGERVGGERVGEMIGVDVGFTRRSFPLEALTSLVPSPSLASFPPSTPPPSFTIWGVFIMVSKIPFLK